MGKIERWFWMALSGTFIVLYLLKGCNKEICPTVEPIAIHDTVPTHTPIPISVIPAKPQTKNPLTEKKEILSYFGGSSNEMQTGYIPIPLNNEYYDTLPCPDYSLTRYYSDTNKVSLGNIIIEDSVSQNKIKSRRVKTDFHFETLKPITIPKHTEFYYGFSIFGNKQTILQMAGINFSMKTKKDYIFEVGGYVGQGNVLYSIGFKRKL